ncbi:L domain-like protein [Piromyces finnis]|uniref:L domain-like protein n=1 Tax=Piromyces finnis TaxID=1754191 RepID=A0A1Y1VBL7_9FUNG|nr:L domain-like protein [Piromyces finnis]|eukprot:ORX52146.1 L domain-like protein [Piromyces finnis]
MAFSLDLVEKKYNNRKTSVSNAFLDQLYSIGINKIFNRTYKNTSLKQKQLLKELKDSKNINSDSEVKFPRIYNNFIVSNSDNILKKLETNDPVVDFYGNQKPDFSNEIEEYKILYKYYQKILDLGIVDISIENKLSIYQYFKSLILINKNITYIDKNFKQFESLKYLSLTGNYIKNIENLPTNIEKLHLNANLISEWPNFSGFNKLIHIGLSYNKISSFYSPLLKNMNDIIPNTIISLDLSYNNFENIVMIINVLSQINNLKILSFIGNPVFLLPHYKQIIISKFDTITVLDEKKISISEKEEYNNFYNIYQNETDLCLNISIKSVINIDGPPICYDEILEPGQGPTEYVFSVKIILNDFEYVETNEEIWNEDNRSVNFNYNTNIIHKADIKARNSFYSGARFILNRKKYSYIKNEKNFEDGNNDNTEKIKNMYTKTLMETIEIYDIKVPLNSFLHGEKIIDNEYILNPLVDENLLKRSDNYQINDKKRGKNTSPKNNKNKNKESENKGKDKKKNMTDKDSKYIEDKENFDLTKKITLSIKLNMNE